MSNPSDQQPQVIRKPVLPLRDIVVFPHMVVPLYVGRDRSIRALEAVSEQDQREIMLVSQREAGNDNPTSKDLYQIGVLGTVLQLLRLPDGTVKVLVEGGQRVRVARFTQANPFFLAEGELLDDLVDDATEAQALVRSVLEKFELFGKLNKKIAPEVLTTLQGIDEPGRLADTAAAHLASLKVSQRQEILEQISVNGRLERLFMALEQEVDVLQVEQRIRGRVKRQMEKSHRDYYLNEQIKAIQKELGEKDDFREELNELTERIKLARMPEEAHKKAESEMRKLKMMSPMSAEATVVRNYIDWLVSLPWSKRSRLKHDLKAAEEILEADHYGLTKIKERILEYLAVQQRVKKMKGPILCLVGPPGVGKTSLAKSLARASGRKYVRVSLGGVRDEAEVRGHRRTYIGSLPGKIIQSMKKAGANNPLFLLDEIDKLGADFRGDPASALLEVLDPEQNCNFNDHYLEVDYDLSNVMFITTANSLNIPRPLLDRMEVIRLPGYTEDEKLHIAKRYLVPRQMEAHGLKEGEFSLSEQGLLEIIRFYTREAGVRNLEREIATLARKSVKELLTNPERVKVAVGVTSLEKYLGVKRYRLDEVEDRDLVGVTTGLAWTEVGGELLTIEATVMGGKGKLTTTGKLGDVMQESAQAALTYVRSRADRWGIGDGEYFQQRDIHIHIPEGATPKDGPSAGIALCVTLVSALTGIPARRDVAMTGEITLRGRVLPIGGLKEKLLAAHRGRIANIIIPRDNVKDLKEIPMSILRDLAIHPVAHMDEVVGLALTEHPAQRGGEPLVSGPPLTGEGVVQRAPVEAPAITH